MTPGPAWQQVTATLTEAIQSGILAPGDELPSITEVSTLQGIGTGVIRHALDALAADGLIIVRHGRAAVVVGQPSSDPRLSRRRPGPGHDCRRAGCRPHVCHPMKPSTIRGIHSILSGAFAAAQRWEWTDRNPAESAKPPTTIRRPIPATSPEDVAKVIAEARARNAALGLYLWLVVVTGVRRGELCGLQIRDIDLDRGLVHVAFNYVVRGGQRVRKDTKTHQDRWLAIDPDTCALIATTWTRSGPRSPLSASSCEMTRTCSPTTRRMPGRGTRTGSPTRSLQPQMPPGWSSTSRAGGITPPASSSPAASICATPPRALATAAAARPRYATMPIRSPRWTGEQPPT